MNLSFCWTFIVSFCFPIRIWNTSKMTKHLFVRTFYVVLIIYTNAHFSLYSACVYVVFGKISQLCHAIHKKCNFPSSHLSFYIERKTFYPMSFRTGGALYKGMTMAVEWSSSIPQHKVWFTKTPNFECIKTFVTTIEHLNIASICVSVSVHRIKHMSTTDMVYELKYIIDTW